MRLFIAEKPNLAKAIANGLGNGRAESGCICCGDDTVTWCFGHMLELAWPQEYKPEYAQWRREHLPIIPSEWKYKVKKDSARQLAVIGSLLREADSVVNGGDPDREGQLLADEVLEHFGYRGPVARIWLPSLDDKSVRIALNDIRDNAPYAPLHDAARARSLADWLVGINATRALTIAGREAGRGEVLSLGRVQTPTLALVVARDREITNFKPAVYFVLRATLTHAAGEFTANFVPSETQAGLDASGRLVDFTQVAAVLERVNGVEGVVAESLRENKSKAAPLPHSLSSLQKTASSRFGMSAQEVLDTAQSLYERKLTTYPRTDCRYLPNEQFDGAAAVLAALSLVPGLEQVAGTADASLKSSAWNTQKVTAHHAIAPTGEMPPDNLKAAERDLYLMIATAFCLQFHPPMCYEARKIVLNLADTRWEVTGRRLTDAGWTAFSKDEEDDRQEEESLPPVEQGDAVTCRTVESVKKKTSPPSRFSEGTLIEAMANVHRFVGAADAKATLKETKGIGTEATRAKVLETLNARGYLANDKKSIVSTPLGRDIIDLTPSALKAPITTADWESRHEAIAQGKETLDAFLAEQKKILPDLLAPILGDGKPAFPCPACGAALNRRKHKKDGSWFWGCTAYPDCRTILPDDNGKPGKARPRPALSGCLGSVNAIGDAFSLGVTLPSMDQIVAGMCSQVDSFIQQKINDAHNQVLTTVNGIGGYNPFKVYGTGGDYVVKITGKLQ